jgi:hypothetical protein
MASLLHALIYGGDEEDGDGNRVAAEAGAEAAARVADDDDGNDNDEGDREIRRKRKRRKGGGREKKIHREKGAPRTIFSIRGVEPEGLEAFKRYKPASRPTRKEVRLMQDHRNPFFKADPELSQSMEGNKVARSRYWYTPPPPCQHLHSGGSPAVKAVHKKLVRFLLARCLECGDLPGAARVTACMHKTGWSTDPLLHRTTVELLRSGRHNIDLRRYFRKVIGASKRDIQRVRAADGIPILHDYITYLCDRRCYKDALSQLQELNQSKGLLAVHSSVIAYAGLVHLCVALGSLAEKEPSSTGPFPAILAYLRQPLSDQSLQLLRKAASAPDGSDPKKHLLLAQSSFQNSIMKAGGETEGVCGLLAATRLCTDEEDEGAKCLWSLVQRLPESSRAWELLHAYLRQTSSASNSDLEKSLRGWLQADPLSLYAMQALLSAKERPDVALPGWQVQALVVQLEHWAATSPLCRGSLVLWEALCEILGRLKTRECVYGDPLGVSDLVHQDSLAHHLGMRRSKFSSDSLHLPVPQSHPVLQSAGIGVQWWGDVFFTPEPWLREPSLDERGDLLHGSYACSSDGESESDSGADEEIRPASLAFTEGGTPFPMSPPISFPMAGKSVVTAADLDGDYEGTWSSSHLPSFSQSQSIEIHVDQDIAGEEEGTATLLSATEGLSEAHLWEDVVIADLPKLVAAKCTVAGHLLGPRHLYCLTAIAWLCRAHRSGETREQRAQLRSKGFKLQSALALAQERLPWLVSPPRSGAS